MTDEPDAYFRCYAWAEGRVLSAADVADLQEVLKDFNDELGKQAELFCEARREALYAIRKAYARLAEKEAELAKLSN